MNSTVRVPEMAVIRYESERFVPLHLANFSRGGTKASGSNRHNEEIT
ncbi:hypothetical protein ACQCT5_07510 [Sutcliffiella halmapala]